MLKLPYFNCNYNQFYYSSNLLPEFDLLKAYLSYFFKLQKRTYLYIIMALKLIDHGTDEYRQMVQLRYDILRKPLGLNFSEEELKKEIGLILIAAFEDNKMLGCCMLEKTNRHTARLRQMAVLNNLQGKGVGRALMQFAENIAIDRGFSRIIMHARKSAIGFYNKLGYETSGDEFEEVSLPHYLMEKNLRAIM